VIVATVGEQTLVFTAGRIETPLGDVPARLQRPVKAVRGVERVEGGVPVNERVQVIVPPGSGEHFRACIVEMDGTIDFDGGDA
jgi:hypothetical protein